MLHTTLVSPHYFLRMRPYVSLEQAKARSKCGVCSQQAPFRRPCNTSRTSPTSSRSVLCFQSCPISELGQRPQRLVLESNSTLLTEKATVTIPLLSTPVSLHNRGTIFLYPPSPPSLSPAMKGDVLYIHSNSCDARFKQCLTEMVYLQGCECIQQCPLCSSKCFLWFQVLKLV
eukprot:jgi/Botrbrau1/15260/Bobra.0382s0002.1